MNDVSLSMRREGLFLLFSKCLLFECIPGLKRADIRIFFLLLSTDFHFIDLYISLYCI